MRRVASAISYSALCHVKERCRQCRGCYGGSYQRRCAFCRCQLSRCAVRAFSLFRYFIPQRAAEINETTISHSQNAHHGRQTDASSIGQHFARNLNQHGMVSQHGVILRQFPLLLSFNICCTKHFGSPSFHLRANNITASVTSESCGFYYILHILLFFNECNIHKRIKRCFYSNFNGVFDLMGKQSVGVDDESH